MYTDETAKKISILGKLVRYGDWRNYVLVDTDSCGFHYLYVQLNLAERKSCVGENQGCKHGYVLYESPNKDDWDEAPYSQLKVLSKDDEDYKHYLR